MNLPFSETNRIHKDLLFLSSFCVDLFPFSCPVTLEHSYRRHTHLAFCSQKALKHHQGFKPYSVERCLSLLLRSTRNQDALNTLTENSAGRPNTAFWNFNCIRYGLKITNFFSWFKVTVYFINNREGYAFMVDYYICC